MIICDWPGHGKLPQKLQGLFVPNGDGELVIPTDARYDGGVVYATFAEEAEEQRLGELHPLSVKAAELIEKEGFPIAGNFCKHKINGIEAEFGFGNNGSIGKCATRTDGSTIGGGEVSVARRALLSAEGKSNFRFVLALSYRYSLLCSIRDADVDTEFDFYDTDLGNQESESLPVKCKCGKRPASWEGICPELITAIGDGITVEKAGLKPGATVPLPCVEDMRRIAHTAWKNMQAPLTDSNKTMRARNLTRPVWMGDIEEEKPSGKLARYIKGKWKKMRLL